MEKGRIFRISLRSHRYALHYRRGGDAVSGEEDGKCGTIYLVLRNGDTSYIHIFHYVSAADWAENIANTK